VSTVTLLAADGRTYIGTCTMDCNACLWSYGKNDQIDVA
jgi:hypothetical protein